MAKLFFLPGRPAIDLNGLVVSGAEITFYITGTNIKQSVYANAGLTVPLTNPVKANAAGRFPSIYLNDAKVYRVKGYDPSDGVTLFDVDPYYPGDASELSADMLDKWAEALAAAALATTEADRAETAADGAEQTLVDVNAAGAAQVTAIGAAGTANAAAVNATGAAQIAAVNVAADAEIALASAQADRAEAAAATVSALKAKQVIGIVTPVTGAASGGLITVALAAPITAAGKVTALRAFALSAFTMKVRRFQKSGDVFTRVGPDYLVPLTVGANVITALGDIPVLAGERLGAEVPTGALVFRLVTGAGVYAASGSQTTFTDTSPDTGVEVQLGFDILSGDFPVLDARVATVEARLALPSAITLANSIKGRSGFLLDFSDPTKLWQDDARTVPVTKQNTPVGSVTDLSGFNDHFSQPTPNKRPRFGKSPLGPFGLYFDGIDDILYSPIVLNSSNVDMTIMFAVALETVGGASIYNEDNPTGQHRIGLLGGTSGGTEAGDADQYAELIAVVARTTGYTHESTGIISDRNLRIATMRIKNDGTGARVVETWIDNRKVDGSLVFPASDITTTQSSIGGRRQSADSTFIRGWVFGGFGVAGALTDAEIAYLQVELARKYRTDISYADGTISVTKTPNVLNMNGHPLVSSVSRLHGVRITDMSKNGPFQNTAYSMMSMGNSSGDNHSACSMLQLSDGRIMAASNYHGASRLSTRVTIEAGSIDKWNPLKVHTIAELNQTQADYPIMAEINGYVYMFIRGWRTADGETINYQNRWFTKIPMADVVAGDFAPTTKMLAGQVNLRPYLAAKQFSPTTVGMLWSSGNPEDGLVINIYYTLFSVIGGVERMFNADGSEITMGAALSSLTPVYSSAITGKRGWVRSITQDAAGRPRLLFVVYDVYASPGEQSIWTAKWTGAAWVTTKVCDIGGTYNMLEPQESAGAVFDPEDCNVLAISRSVNGGLNQIWRYASEDDGATWSGRQLTYEKSGVGAILPNYLAEGIEEPRLTYNTGAYTTYNNYDLVMKRVNSLTGQ